MSELKDQISNATKDAMRAKEKETLATLRMISAALKQVEVDERIELDDARILQILDKEVKKRRESIKMYNDGNRPELAAKEEAEIKVLQTFLPEQLSNDDILAMIDDAIEQTGASNMKDMGKLMGTLKPKLQGRADMGAVSGLIKSKLN